MTKQEKPKQKDIKEVACPIDGELMAKEDCEGCGWFINCWSNPSYIA